MKKINFVGTIFFLAVLPVGGCAESKSNVERFDAIPLSEVYFTLNQKGLKTASLGESLPFKDDLEYFVRAIPTASNIFLMRGQNLQEAIQAGINFRGRN